MVAADMPTLEKDGNDMTIKVGDRVPAMTFKQQTPDGISDLTTDKLFGGKTVVLFAVPGAFTPTCSAKHVPSFVNNFDKLLAKGVDTVACVSVNDVFVMGAWGRDQKSDGKVVMLADGNGEFTKAVGLEMDARGYGMGIRSQRYALVAKDGVVTVLNIEAPGAFEVSSGDAILQAL